jgi:hypothetical protein
MHQITEQAISSLNGRYEIFTPDSENTTLDEALTLKKYWWKDWTGKGKYSLSLTAIDTRHLKVEIYKDNILLDTKTVNGKVEDGYFVIKHKKILFFYFLLNGFGQLRTRIGLDTSGNLVVDSHHIKFATLFIIPLTGGRVEQYGLVLPKKNASR